MVTGFFLTMNFLLWRSEFGPRGRVGGAVPTDVVWEKVLTCPDNSYLEIRHKGAPVGRAHWVASVGDELTSGKMMTEELPPEGMIKSLSSYSLEFSGSLSLDPSTRVRFSCDLKLDTNQVWQEFNLKLALKPEAWEIHASAPQQTLRFVTVDDEGQKEQSFSFDDMKDPEKLARAIGGPWLPGALGALGFPLKQATPSGLALRLHWEARNDWFTVGRNPIRVYRLEARLFDRYKAVILVSPVGEILRMELPDEIILTNEALTTL